MKILVGIAIGIVVTFAAINFHIVPHKTSFVQIVSEEIPKPLEDRMFKRWIGQVGAWLPNEQWAQDEVRKNTRDHIAGYLKVVSNIDAVFISKTQDTGNGMITLRDGNGFEATLWLDADGKVNSVDYDGNPTADMNRMKDEIKTEFKNDNPILSGTIISGTSTRFHLVVTGTASLL